MTIASTPMRTSLRAKPRAGAKQKTRAPLRLILLHRGAARQAAGEHDVADPMLGADLDQIEQLRMQGDQVDAERAPGQRLGRADLGRQQLRRHRSRGDDPEPAGIGDGGDQVALRYPGHRAAHDGEIAAENIPAARPQPVELGAGAAALRVLLAARAPFARWKIRCADALGHPAASSP